LKGVEGIAFHFHRSVF